MQAIEFNADQMSPEYMLNALAIIRQQASANIVATRQIPQEDVST